MRSRIALLLLLATPLLPACSGDAIYAACEASDDCEVPDDAAGVCLDKGGEGFCTWECAADADCDYDDEADAYGEDISRICASFEDEPSMYCFPPCDEGADGDGDAACPVGLTCRSTGGGDENRKVCFPAD